MCVCLCVYVEFSSDLVTARDDTVIQQWLHFPSCPAPGSPSHQSHRSDLSVCMFVQCFCSYSAEVHCSVEWQHGGVRVCLYSGGTSLAGCKGFQCLRSGRLVFMAPCHCSTDEWGLQLQIRVLI